MSHPHRTIRNNPLATRRGIAAPIVMLTVLAATGMAVMSLQDASSASVQAAVLRESSRADQIAAACASAAIPMLPRIMDFYTMSYQAALEADPGATYMPIVHQQWDPSFFGDDPFGDAIRDADCVIQIVDIASAGPGVGSSANVGCFSRVTLHVTATVGMSGAISDDITQNITDVVSEVVTRVLVGPGNCNW